MIGGENSRDQLQPFRDQGVHALRCGESWAAQRFSQEKKYYLGYYLSVVYICLDEADRMLDLGFDEEAGEIMNHFQHQRQTLLFSATFPKKFQDFAKQTLIWWNTMSSRKLRLYICWNVCKRLQHLTNDLSAKVKRKEVG